MYKSDNAITFVSVLSEGKVRQLLKGSVILTDGTSVHLCKSGHFGNALIFIMMNQLKSHLPVCTVFPDSSTNCTTKLPCYKDVYDVNIK